MSYEWRTYPSGRADGTSWIERLTCSRRAKNQLWREARRLSELVRTRQYYGEGGRIPPEQLEDFRHDLALWSDPAAVADLLDRYGHNILGPKTLAEVREALAAYKP